MAKITAHRAADGALSYRVQFRPRPGANPTRETFATADAAQRFIDLAADIGWAELSRSLGLESHLLKCGRSILGSD